MPDYSIDEKFMRHALDLAREGMGLASPNPYVGAVIVNSDGRTVGAGAYTYAGKKHAEIIALENAGDQARGSTLYINLEPHSHQGRTPPCTDALIAAGIRRVVASMADPNPKVSGRGFEILRAAGVIVEVGLLEDEARYLNEPFAKYIRHLVPLVTLKSAMTLDGSIAVPQTARETGEDKPGTQERNWITGKMARSHVHEMRHQADAIMVGIGTILADDPLLTDRSNNPRRRPLLRVILDSNLRLPLASRIVRSTESSSKTMNDVLIFCCSADPAKKQQLENCGIRVEQIHSSDRGRPDFHSILRRLGELEIMSLMIEGGSTVNRSALDADVVDKLFLYYAPKIFVGSGSIPFAGREGLPSKRQALQVKHLQLHRFAQDFAVEAYLRDPCGD